LLNFWPFSDALRHEHARRLGERNLRGEVALGSLHSLQLDLKILLLELTVEGSQESTLLDLRSYLSVYSCLLPSAEVSKKGLA